MGTVLTVNADTTSLARAMGRPDVEQMFDIAVTESFMCAQPRAASAPSPTLRLLWVGRIIPRKGLPIALEALAQVRCPATLTIVGESRNEAKLRKTISDLGLTDRIQWAGKRLPWPEVRQMYLGHDVLVFTSVRETCGAQLLEAMALGLPVITLDLHGARDLVPQTAGIKVPLTPLGVVRGLANAIDTFAELTEEERAAMSLAGWRFAAQNTWPARAERAAKVYERLIRSWPALQTEPAAPTKEFGKHA